MRQPVACHLLQLRWSNRKDPQYGHLIYFLNWPWFFLMYYLTENLIPPEKCTIVWSPLDDLIPFNQYFVIPYAGWYLLLIFSLIYFALYKPKSFVQLSSYIIITQVVAMAIYILFPSCQNLRPTSFPQDTILTRIMGYIYATDTNTCVCPSLHVAYSLGMASVWLRQRYVHLSLRLCIAIFCGLICISVAFVKQHSVLDIAAALPLGLLAEYLVFYHKWRRNPV